MILHFGTWYAAQADAAIAATSLTAGLVLLFASTIDRFESLKGLGIEAKTRQLNEKIEQADESLRRLRQLAELTCTALVDLHSKMRRRDSAPTPREAVDLAERVRSIMQALGSEPHAIEIALRPWVRILCLELTYVLTAPLRELVQMKIQELEKLQGTIPMPSDPENREFQKLNE